MTRRELDTLRLLAEGLSDRAIAQELVIALETVKWYNKQIYAKLGVGNRTEAVLRAQTLGLLDNSNDSKPTHHRHNLPAQTTLFIGRHRELRELIDLLANVHIRLLTILASGGMGKSRLALAAAETQLYHFPDGVFFVPLAPLNSPDDLVTTIAEHVGFSFYGSDPPRQQLLDYFRERRTLLVLDNFEHLLGGVSLVAAIIQGAPQVKVLVTSRERLNLSSETVFTLSGLQSPAWETPEDAHEYDAVKLFIQSAQRIRPDFALNTDQLNHLVRICRLTAGMPLGIVLAGGWVDALPLEQIAAELQQGIDILETELRDMPERQRSVRSTFNYTWVRLSEAERDIFMKLSIFRGGFTSDSAQAVAGAMTSHLRKLVDRALVQMLPSGRYDIHELLRQYANEKLLQADEGEGVASAHSSYFASFMQVRVEDIKGRRQLAGLNEIEIEFDNLRVAWAYIIELSDYDTLDRMMECMVLFCKMRARYQEGESLLQAAIKALDLNDAGRNQSVWNRLQVWWLMMPHLSERNVEAERKQLAICQALAEQQGDAKTFAICVWIGIEWDAASARFDREAIAERYQGAISQFHALGEEYYVARILRNVGWLYLALPRNHNNPAFIASNESLLNLTQAIGDRIGMADALLMAALREDYSGRYADSLPLLQEARAISTEMRDQIGLGHEIVPEAFLSLFQGEFVDALHLAEQLISIGLTVNRWNLLVNGRAIQSFIAVVQGDYETGQALGRKALPAPEVVHFFNHTAWRSLALAAICLGDLQQAKRHAKVGLKKLTDQDDPRDAIQWLLIVALLVGADGNADHAVELLGLAFNHSDSITGWLDQWLRWPQLRQDLANQLGHDAYVAAWERGESLDLETVITALLAEFTP